MDISVIFQKLFSGLNKNSRKGTRKETDNFEVRGKNNRDEVNISFRIKGCFTFLYQHSGPSKVFLLQFLYTDSYKGRIYAKQEKRTEQNVFDLFLIENNDKYLKVSLEQLIFHGNNIKIALCWGLTWQVANYHATVFLLPHLQQWDGVEVKKVKLVA